MAKLCYIAINPPLPMMPIPEFHRVTDNLFIWHGFHPGCNCDCTSTALRTPEGFVFIDPLQIEEQALGKLVGNQKVAAILLTNSNHERSAAYEKERLDIPIYAPWDAADEVNADIWVRDGDRLFGKLTAISLPGGSHGEMAYLTDRTLIIGDALVNLSGLQVLPEKYAEDPDRLMESLRTLSLLDFEILCMAHGLPLIGNAKSQVASLLTEMDKPSVSKPTAI